MLTQKCTKNNLISTCPVGLLTKRGTRGVGVKWSGYLIVQSAALTIIEASCCFIINHGRPVERSVSGLKLQFISFHNPKQQGPDQAQSVGVILSFF